MMYNCNNHKTIFSHNKGVPVANSIHHSNSIYNYFKSLKLGLFLSELLFTRHYPARCFGMNMPKSRDIQREFMRLA